MSDKNGEVIRKVLVANRAEIARRIFRTCRSMGIGTVAVFSEADAEAPFVAEADEGFALGGNTPAESYLRIDRLLEAASITGADAVHPGYGFLSENADFAQAVIDAGLTWIGPSPDSIRAMGSKLEAKRTVEAAGVPTLSSIDLSGLDADQIDRAGDKIGYPLLVKASAGGGGKGMRIVRSESELSEAVAGAQREAVSAFGDGTVFIERYLDSTRHIEIQVFGDNHGNVAALFERECSIQRRHQKILEESPSTALDDTARQKMSDAAIAAAKAVNYQSAGTVEFVYDRGDFYFLEMNTRLQVEHPVTEEITGLDLVRWQIKVANGEVLTDELLEPVRFGHAIEVRLYAEDPMHDFLPVSGRIDRFEFDELIGLRVDAGVESGAEISSFYDPMIAKVIAWGETREEAAALLAQSLQTARIHGPVNNRELLIRLLRHPEFLAGDTDTGFLERHSPAELGASLPSSKERSLAALAAAVASSSTDGKRLLPGLRPAWRNNPSQLQETTFTVGGEVLRVGFRFGDEFTSSVGNGIQIHSATSTRVGLREGDHLLWFNVNAVGSTVHVDGPGGYARLVKDDRFSAATVEEDAGSLHAPMPGKVIKVNVVDGESIDEGQVLLVLEAMKMEHSLRAHHKGIVREVRVTAGDQVAAGEVVVVVD
ncbi:MAG: acetyl/propionyl/methylcrotonyl-CoA carboxylase subunit alpha [Acidimicrobiia bacterium]